MFSPVCPVILVFYFYFFLKPSGLKCGNLAKHFVPHASLFSTPVQKYRHSVKAIIHNSPPSVHSTCCVIKAVLYPVFLPLVSISFTPALFVLCTQFFSFLFIFIYFCLSHILVHILSLSLSRSFSLLSYSPFLLFPGLSFSYSMHSIFSSFLSVSLLFVCLFFLSCSPLHTELFLPSPFLKYRTFSGSQFQNAYQYPSTSS